MANSYDQCMKLLSDAKEDSSLVANHVNSGILTDLNNLIFQVRNLLVIVEDDFEFTQTLLKQRDDLLEAFRFYASEFYL